MLTVQVGDTTTELHCAVHHYIPDVDSPGKLGDTTTELHCAVHT